MEMKALCGVSTIQKVSEDRAGEAQGVSTVNAELMCASGVGMEYQICSSVRVLADGFVFGMSRFPLPEVHFLPWSLIIVRR